MSTISSSYFISSLITRRSGKSAQIIWNPTLYNMDALTENSYLKTFYAVISMKNLSQKNLLNFGLNSRYNAFTHWSTETHNHKSSVIRQRVNLETGVSRKQSTPYIPKNEHFLPHNTHMYVSISGGKKYSFFGKFSVLCFLEKPVLRFALLPYYRRNRRAYRVPSENNHLRFKFSLESFPPIMIKFLGLQDFLIFNSSHSNSHSFLPENVNKITLSIGYVLEAY